MKGDRSLLELADFAESELQEVFRRFVFGHREEKIVEKAKEEVRARIEAELGDKAGLLESYDELAGWEKRMFEMVGLTAGMRAAFRLLSVIHNPQLLIFPAWGESAEETCQRVLEEMKQVLDGKSA